MFDTFIPSSSKGTILSSNKETIHLIGLANLRFFPPHFMDLGKLIDLITFGIFNDIISLISCPIFVIFAKT